MARKIASDLKAYRLEGNWFDVTDAVVAYLERRRYVQSYKWVDGHPYAVLWREMADGETEPCPFCGLNHYHREADGVCGVHCRTRNPYQHAADGTILKQADDDLLKTRLKAVVPFIRDDKNTIT